MTTAARVDFRTTPELKSLIERAATYQGMTVAEYVKSIVLDRSREIVAAHETLVLSDRDRDRFLDLLENPPEPNAKLKAAAADYREAIESGRVISR